MDPRGESALLLKGCFPRRIALSPLEIAVTRSPRYFHSNAMTGTNEVGAGSGGKPLFRSSQDGKLSPTKCPAAFERILGGFPNSISPGRIFAAVILCNDLQWGIHPK